MRRITLATTLPALLSLTVQSCSDSGTAPRAPSASSAATLTVAEGGGGRRSVTSVFHGDYATYSSFTSGADGFTYAYLVVGRDDSRDAEPVTTLSYFVNWCAPDFSTCELRHNGSGPIPNGDFTGGGAGHYRLRTDTNANPDFQVWSGPGGVIDVSWRKLDLFSARSHGIFEYSYPDISVHRQGESRLSAAAVDGTLIDLALSELRASTSAVGTARETQIVRY